MQQTAAAPKNARAREAAGGAVGARRGFVIAIFARSTGRARRAAGLGKSAGRADITRGRARTRGARAVEERTRRRALAGDLQRFARVSLSHRKLDVPILDTFFGSLSLGLFHLPKRFPAFG